MQKISKNPLVKPPEKKWAQFKGTGATVAALCIVCTVFIATLVVGGCNEKEVFSKMNDETSVKSFEPALAWDYPVKPGTAEWKKFNSYKEMVKACQIPESVLSSLSTEDLTEICLQYPHLWDIYAFQNTNTGLDKLFSGFNGIRELYKRKDMSVSLTNRYIQKILSFSFLDENNSDLEKGNFIISVSVLEGLLSRIEQKDNAVEVHKEVLQSLVAGYEAKWKYKDYFRGFGAQTNFYARAQVIAKMDKSFVDQLPQKSNNAALYSGMCDEKSVRMIDEFSYQLIK